MIAELFVRLDLHAKQLQGSAICAHSGLRDIPDPGSFVRVPNRWWALPGRSKFPAISPQFLSLECAFTLRSPKSDKFLGFFESPENRSVYALNVIFIFTLLRVLPKKLQEVLKVTGTDDEVGL